jgi:hypothetical protein
MSGSEELESVTFLAILKCPRLLRLGRILKFLENMRGANVWRIVRLFALFFLMSHWIGCIWFLLADDGAKIDGIDEAEFEERYVYAIFQGLLLLVGESIDAVENHEFVFIVIAMALGQALSATIFGSMASLIKNIDQGHDLYTHKLDTINEHMRYH